MNDLNDREERNWTIKKIELLPQSHWIENENKQYNETVFSLAREYTHKIPNESGWGHNTHTQQQQKSWVHAIYMSKIMIKLVELICQMKDGCLQVLRTR